MTHFADFLALAPESIPTDFPDVPKMPAWKWPDAPEGITPERAKDLREGAGDWTDPENDLEQKYVQDARAYRKRAEVQNIEADARRQCRWQIYWAKIMAEEVAAVDRPPVPVERPDPAKYEREIERIARIGDDYDWGSAVAADAAANPPPPAEPFPAHVGDVMDRAFATIVGQADPPRPPAPDPAPTPHEAAWVSLAAAGLHGMAADIALSNVGRFYAMLKKLHHFHAHTCRFRQLFPDLDPGTADGLKAAVEDAGKLLHDIEIAAPF